MRTRTLLATALVAVIATTVTVGLAATPASAAPPPDSMFGYVWGWQPANPNYIAATGYESNSAGGAVRITRPVIGTYQVRFLGMAGTGGVAHASAYGNNNICTISSYGPLWADELVNVRCFNVAGAPVDTRFVANVTNRKPAGSFGYLRSDIPVPPIGGYVPPAAWSYDSTGAPIVISRSAVGHYQIQLGTFAQDSPALWTNG